MKNKLIIILLVLVALMGGAIYFLWATLEKRTAQSERYMLNANALVTQVREFKVRDSLNAVKVDALNITIQQLNELHKADAKLIKDLKVSKAELTELVTVQSRTITEIKGEVFSRPAVETKERIVYIRDSLKVLDYSDKFIDIHLKIGSANKFWGTIETRDSLKIIENTEYARFLGFLWRTKRVKRTSITVVSDNPHTNIINTEYIKIHK